MSEFSKHAEKRVESIYNYMSGIIEGKSGIELIKKNNILDTEYQPEDILTLFEKLLNSYTVDEIKIPSNKLFNLLHKTLEKQSLKESDTKSFLTYIKKDNNRFDKILQDAKKSIKSVNDGLKVDDISNLIEIFKNFQLINKHYTIMENVLFPILEDFWTEHQCLKLMWSFHDDIRRNIKKCLDLLLEPMLDIKQFNSLTARLYFDIYTIIFREESILFPIMNSNFDIEILDKMLFESKKLGFSFIKKDEIKISNLSTKNTNSNKDGQISLSTGNLSLEQLELLFKHLPVDLTFVDENNIVKYYSDPPHRVFPRTNSVIGRKVENCHPPESIDIVNRIIESFRNGVKNDASFWIKIRDKFILIRYFAIRNENNAFKGTLEVSQEISDIQKLKGENRLLNWD